MSQHKIITPVKDEKPASKNYIFVKQNKNMLVKIFYDDISHIQSNKDYCLIFTHAEIFCIHYSLEKMINNLPAEKFYRCHRQYIINVDRIKLIASNTIYIDQYTIPVSNNKYDDLLGNINFVPAAYSKKK